MATADSMNSTDHFIDSSLPGLKTALRNKHQDPEGPAVLFIHGLKME